MGIGCSACKTQLDKNAIEECKQKNKELHDDLNEENDNTTNLEVIRILNKILTKHFTSNYARHTTFIRGTTLIRGTPIRGGRKHRTRRKGFLKLP